MFLGATYVAFTGLLEYTVFSIPATLSSQFLLNLFSTSGFQFFVFWYTWRYARALDSLPDARRRRGGGARDLLVGLLRPFHQMPALAHLFIWMALYCSLICVLLLTEPEFTVLVSGIVGILGIWVSVFRGRVRTYGRRLESVFSNRPESEKESESAQQHAPTITEKIIAAIVVVTILLACLDTMFEYWNPTVAVFDFTGTTALYLFMIAGTMYAIMLRHRYFIARYRSHQAAG